MADVLSEEVERFVRAAAPEQDEILAEMDDRGRDTGFPTVGPAVGGLLELLARTVDAERVFEFGSGFGYSAYWFAQALPADGTVVLTEHDADELADAREYFERGGLADRASFEAGDALDAVKRYDGPFDVVLIDHQKDRYPEAFEAVREKVPPGGVVVADNAMTASVLEFEKLLAVVEGDDPGEMNEHTRGVADYLTRVRDDPDFRTVVVPMGEGVSVSYRIE